MTGEDTPILRWTLRWKKRWTSDDGRGTVQSYATGRGVMLYDAWLDGRFLGQSHRFATAKEMVLEAMNPA